MIKSRIGDANDIEAILDAAEAMNAESSWGLTWSRDVGENYVTWLIDNDTTDVLIVERDGERCAGAFVAASWEFHLQPLCYVCKFWVVKEHRRGDVSKVLVEDILQWAHLRNCSHVFSTATAGLSAAEQMLFIRLMKSHGFKDVGPVLEANLGGSANG